MCKFASMEVPIITRDTYDLIRFPNCSGYRTEDFSCHLVLKRGVRFGDKRTCTCKCKEGFVTYRDPFVKYVGRKFQYQNDKRGCVWYGEYHEGKSFTNTVFIFFVLTSMERKFGMVDSFGLILK